MKKILVVLVLLFPLSVFAIDDVNITNHHYYICDETGNAYALYDLNYQSNPLFLLNYTENLNLNFNDYKKVDYNDSPYLKNVQDYLWILSIINFNTDYRNDYQYVTRFLWENIYPEKSFSFCNEDANFLVIKELEYEIIKKRVQGVIDGPEILKEVYYQKSYETKKYQDELLRYYYIYDPAGLNFTFNDDTLIAQGNAAEYHVQFRIKPNLSDNIDLLYTDGVNYLASYPMQPTNDYILNIIIEPLKLSFVFNDEIRDKNLCLNLYEEDEFIDKKCLDNQEKVDFFLDKGKYRVQLLDNDYYESFDEIIDLTDDTEIVLSLKTNNIMNEPSKEDLEQEKVIPTDKNEEIIKDMEVTKINNEDYNIVYVNVNPDNINDNTITFIPKNTYKSNSVVLIFTLLSYYVICKKK